MYLHTCRSSNGKEINEKADSGAPLLDILVRKL